MYCPVKREEERNPTVENYLKPSRYAWKAMFF